MIPHEKRMDDERRERLKKGPAEVERLEVPPGGGAAQTPYPDYDVAREDKWQLDWDGKTREVVSKRVREVPPFRFFSAEEAALLEAICARALPQPDRVASGSVPIAPYIDERLYTGGGDGYHRPEMPPDRLAYKYGLVGVEQSARTVHGAPFGALDAAQQDAVLQAIADGSPPGRVWESGALPPKQFFQLLMKDVVAAYYAHPEAWSEIGFNGPASPRGHVRLALGSRDPWEAEEKRPRSSAELVRQAKARR
ncbi:MAG: gluconate 2-dehydrogenase subunit 3 family protein [Candidatus Promineifilaceae bacterium]|nr:gluconate 2-dehydrogenase subunit 3 family protein [Candidatus Promineifilaceae bacterium]